MSSASLLPGSMSSGEFHIIDPERAKDIDRKHQNLTEFIREHSYDGLLLTRPENFSWFTTGGDASRGSWSDLTSGLFITPEARVLLSRNTDATQIFDRDIPGLGFQLKERLWQEDRAVLMSDLCRGRNVACDQPFERCEDVSLHVGGLRTPL